jgi:hypothetical protein
MTLFWTLKSIPELASLSARERRVTWRRAYRRTWRHWQTWAALLVCGICGGLGALVGSLIHHPVLIAMIGGGVGGWVFSQVTVHIARAHYQNVLLGRDS